MDAILNGILSSRHPDALKKQLITKVTENSSKPQPVRVIRSVLQISSSWFLQGESDIPSQRAYRCTKPGPNTT